MSEEVNPQYLLKGLGKLIMPCINFCQAGFTSDPALNLLGEHVDIGYFNGVINFRYRCWAAGDRNAKSNKIYVEMVKCN